ncbi:hypothetical protein B0T19DRAFT_5291 [Cercophora scortea]|uniref:C2H2-type domain-containing protein n=1 Tax=Cercophora scortea TaxID=314031 RepID=A0AAE0I2D6_9PEZI|nr:hypothetical protein B0T19DRAFT_302654 [Cercophora scortea]KAK3335332.1 hypothetical protein B0T19DRAFT_5291 [Cercophora scortea]
MDIDPNCDLTWAYSTINQPAVPTLYDSNPWELDYSGDTASSTYLAADILSPTSFPSPSEYTFAQESTALTGLESHTFPTSYNIHGTASPALSSNLSFRLRHLSPALEPSEPLADSSLQPVSPSDFGPMPARFIPSSVTSSEPTPAVGNDNLHEFVLNNNTHDSEYDRELSVASYEYPLGEQAHLTDSGPAFRFYSGYPTMRMNSPAPAQYPIPEASIHNQIPAFLTSHNEPPQAPGLIFTSEVPVHSVFTAAPEFHNSQANNNDDDDDDDNNNNGNDDDGDGDNNDNNRVRPAFIRNARVLTSADVVARRQTYVCSYDGCNRKPFRNQSKLKYHVERHTRPYICPDPECGKDFGSKGDLERHIGSVHPARAPPGSLTRYVCWEEECDGRTFPRRDNFKEHMKVHKRKNYGKQELGGGAEEAGTSAKEMAQG